MITEIISFIVGVILALAWRNYLDYRIALMNEEKENSKQ